MDTFNGGDGTDTVDYSNVAEQQPEYFLGRTGVIVNLANGIGGEVGEAYDHFDSIENITGSNFDDAIFGDANVNVLRGMDGNDIIEGGAGGDTLDGGGGSDTLSYAGSNTRVTVNLQNNTATGGHATGDVISLFENITGSAFNDTLTGNNDANTIEGGAGADTLDGAGGFNDTVSYRYSNAGVTVNLLNNTASGGHATGDTILRFGEYRRLILRRHAHRIRLEQRDPGRGRHRHDRRRPRRRHHRRRSGQRHHDRWHGSRYLHVSGKRDQQCGPYHRLQCV